MKPYLLCLSFLLAFTQLFFLPSLPGQTPGGIELRTVVIDPGHGGKDPGSHTKDNKVLEKNLTLAISKLLGQKIKDAYPKINVVYTRTTDKYLTLNERADIANHNKADLFISVHINAVPQAAPNGFSVFILGKYNKKGTDMFDANAEVCRRENSVIMMEDDYASKYNGFDPNDPESLIFFHLLQNANFEQSLLFASQIDGKFNSGPFANNRGIYQDVFYVLWKTTMPAVLIEAGFISNTADLKVMNSTAGREDIARRLFEAFCDFKKEYDKSFKVPEPAAPTVSYGVQILAISRNLADGDPAFKGYSPKIFQSGQIYKYVIPVEGAKSDADTILKSVKKDFPDSFIVRIQDGKIMGL